MHTYYKHICILVLRNSIAEPLVVLANNGILFVV